MAKDFQSKKRKAPVPERDAENLKKVKNVVDGATGAPAKKRKATEDAAPVKAKKSKNPADSTTTEDLVPAQVNKTRTSKSNISRASDSKTVRKVEAGDKSVKKEAKAAEASDKPLKEPSNGASAPKTTKNDKSILKKHKASEENVQAKTNGQQTENEDDDVEEDEDSHDEIDDQTDGLLKGFESDGDEEDDKIKDGYKDGDAIPEITENKGLSKKRQAKLKKAADFSGQDKPGVVYVGRIPHGFYENEMRAYFKQFGNILKLRLSRNKRTSASRHYAFIQFESSTVADIVAKTMDNYLMFGHLLKVKFVPEEQVPADVFKGANKRFKKVPWNKIKGRELEQGASKEVWDERVNKEQARRDKKAEKLKAIGYEFDSPKIKFAKNVSKEKLGPELIGDEGQTKAIEAVPVAEESSEPREEKKKSKAAKEADGAAGVEEPSKSEKEEKSVAAKPSKEDVEESVTALIAETTEKSIKKKKKDKKNKNKDVTTPELTDKEVKVNPTEVAPPAEPSSNKPKKDKKNKAKVVAG